MPLDLIEFPADDLARTRRFWETLLDVSLDERREGEGEGLQTREARPSLGLHERGRGPGDCFSLPSGSCAPTQPEPSCSKLDPIKASAATSPGCAQRWRYGRRGEYRAHEC